MRERAAVEWLDGGAQARAHLRRPGEGRSSFLCRAPASGGAGASRTTVVDGGARTRWVLRPFSLGLGFAFPLILSIRDRFGFVSFDSWFESAFPELDLHFCVGV